MLSNYIIARSALLSYIKNSIAYCICMYIVTRLGKQKNIEFKHYGVVLKFISDSCVICISDYMQAHYST